MQRFRGWAGVVEVYITRASRRIFGEFPWIRVSRFYPPVATVTLVPRNTPSLRRGISTRCGDLTVRNRATTRRNSTRLGKRKQKKEESATGCLDIRAAPDPAITRIQKARSGGKSSGFVPGRRYRAETALQGAHLQYTPGRARNRRIRRRHHAPGQDSETTRPPQARDGARDRRMPHGGGNLHTTSTTVVPGRRGRRPRVAESLSLETTRERISTDGRDRTTHDRRDRYVSGVQSSR